jgi:molecular chaperone DnaJ
VQGHDRATLAASRKDDKHGDDVSGVFAGHLIMLRPVQPPEPDHYAVLGLDRRCTDAQIRNAYRLLARQHHPDVNSGCSDAMARTQKLNAAYEVLSDPAARSTYDEARIAGKQKRPSARSAKLAGNISQDMHLLIGEFFRGTTLEVRVNDPANPNGGEIYELLVPPDTAPGTRFRVPRLESPDGGFVLVRVRLRPDFRFKPRGSDLRCDLRISVQLAVQGGSEMITSATGARLRVTIPKSAARGEIVRLPGEGLPKPRGGRGDLLVRIIYRPEVRITRCAKR